jgi:uncharacterized protein (TIGR04141 family)
MESELVGEIPPPQASLEVAGADLPLSVLLLAHDAEVSELQTLADKDHVITWFHGAGLVEFAAPSSDVELQVAVRRSRKRQPTWRPFLRQFGLPLPADSLDESLAVLVVARSTVTQQDRWVVYCFGGASRAMPSELLDTRFGVVTALNRHATGDDLDSWREVPVGVRRRVVGDPTARVRRVSGEVRDVFRHRMDARADSASSLQGLRFDKVSDLLRSLSVRTNDELMRDVEGGRTLRFTTYLDSLDDFVVLADYLVDLRERTDYKAEWGWIDQIVPVDTRAEADVVLREIVGRIGTPDEPAVDLVLPDWAAQNDHPSKRLLVALPGERGTPQRVLTSWKQLRSWIIKNSSDHEDPSALMRKRIRAGLEGMPSGDVESVAISDLIVTELKIDGRLYVVSDGEVYRVEGSFLKRLDDELERIPWSTFPYPDYQGGNEPDYLDAVKRSPNSRLAVLDRLNVKLPGESAFEACDLLTNEGTLVFAKMKGRSATFSHLCTQAVVSAEMLVREPQVRIELLSRAMDANAGHEILDAVQDRLGRLEAREQGCMKICLLVLGTWNSEPNVRSLPLVSRLLLQKTWQRISGHGFDLELASPVARLRPTK